MTRDPERLLSITSEVDSLEHELLASLRDEQAPASVRRGAWQGIAAALVAAAPASAAAAGAAFGSTGALSASSGASSAGASAAVSGTAGGAVASGSAVAGGKLAAALGTKAAALLVTKWVLVGALGAGAVGGAIWAVDRTDAPRNAPPPPAALAAHPETKPAARQVVAAPPVVPAAAVEPPVAADHKSTKPVRVNALAAESALLQSARAELRAGNLEGASDALQHLRRRFPRGVLNQERDVLRIELASARGDEAGARRLAARFLRAYPESPHAAQLRPLTAAP